MVPARCVRIRIVNIDNRNLITARPVTARGYDAAALTVRLANHKANTAIMKSVLSNNDFPPVSAIVLHDGLPGYLNKNTFIA